MITCLLAYSNNIYDSRSNIYNSKYYWNILLIFLYQLRNEHKSPAKLILKNRTSCMLLDGNAYLNLYILNQ